MKVVSWNIVHGIDTDGAVDALRTEDRLTDPDVLLLQEMDEPGTAAIATALDLHYVYVSASVHPKTGRDFGNAVLSREPLEARLVVDLPHKARVGGQSRNAISAVARFDGYPITLCATHTEIPAMSAAKRLDQFNALASAAEGFATPHVIVGGDFNTVTRKGVRSLIGVFEEANFLHVSIDAVTTLRRIGQDFTLDHVFARGLTPIESGVVHGLDVSDHAPIWAELEPVASATDPEPWTSMDLH